MCFQPSQKSLRMTPKLPPCNPWEIEPRSVCKQGGGGSEVWKEDGHSTKKPSPRPFSIHQPVLQTGRMRRKERRRQWSTDPILPLPQKLPKSEGGKKPTTTCAWEMVAWSEEGTPRPLSSFKPADFPPAPTFEDLRSRPRYLRCGWERDGDFPSPLLRVRPPYFFAQAFPTSAILVSTTAV